MTPIDISNEIKHYLNSWQGFVKMSNSNNENAASVFSENIVAEILNVLLNSNLNNTNIIKSNYKSIDLLDTEQLIGVQVTSNQTSLKVFDTIKGIVNDFDTKPLNELYIVIIGSKKNIKQEKVNELSKNKIQIDVRKNILDIEDIYKKIINSDIERINKIKSILSNNFKISKAKTKENRNEIGISFDLKDKEFTIKIIKKLIDSGFEIITTSNEVFKYINADFYKEKINIIQSKNLPNSSKHCIILITKTYYNNFLISSKICPLVEKYYNNKSDLTMVRNASCGDFAEFK